MFDKEKIDLELLKYAINEILSSLLKSGKRFIPLEHDYYWEINENELYKPEQDVKEITLGQLHDDWDFVNALIQDMKNDISDNSVRCPIMLMHVWPLLRYIYHKEVLRLDKA